MLVDNEENVFLTQLVITVWNVAFSYVNYCTNNSCKINCLQGECLADSCSDSQYLFDHTVICVKRCTFLAMKLSFEKKYTRCFSPNPEFMGNRFTSILLISHCLPKSTYDYFKHLMVPLIATFHRRPIHIKTVFVNWFNEEHNQTINKKTATRHAMMRFWCKRLNLAINMMFF